MVPSGLSGHSSRRRKLLGAALALALPTALALSGGTLARAASTQPAAAAVAPAFDGAAAGGKVIVVLKQQQAGMNLRTQASQRIAAAHADQAPVVTAIRSHGGTGVTQLAAPDAVAATVPAAEVARLRRNPAVAEIVSDTRIQVSQVHTEAAPPARSVHVSSRPRQQAVRPRVLAGDHRAAADARHPGQLPVPAGAGARGSGGHPRLRRQSGRAG